MATHFELVEGEILRALRRITDRCVLARAEDRLTGLEQATEITWRAADLRTDQMRSLDLERVRDFASELGHRVNALAPSGVLWAVVVNFRRFAPFYSAWEWRLEIRWAIVPDPFRMVS